MHSSDARIFFLRQRQGRTCRYVLKRIASPPRRTTSHSGNKTIAKAKRQRASMPGRRLDHKIHRRAARAAPARRQMKPAGRFRNKIGPRLSAPGSSSHSLAAGRSSFRRIRRLFGVGRPVSPSCRPSTSGARAFITAGNRNFPCRNFDRIGRGGRGRDGRLRIKGVKKAGKCIRLRTT